MACTLAGPIDPPETLEEARPVVAQGVREHQPGSSKYRQYSIPGRSFSVRQYQYGTNGSFAGFPRLPARLSLFSSPLLMHVRAPVLPAKSKTREKDKGRAPRRPLRQTSINWPLLPIVEINSGASVCGFCTILDPFPVYWLVLPLFGPSASTTRLRGSVVSAETSAMNS